MPKQLQHKFALLRAILAACALATTLQPALAADNAKLLDGVVNVNTADIIQLQLLPGVGEVRAEAILETRKTRGGFKDVGELTEVRGIGKAMVEIIRPYVTLSGKTTARRL
jgi:competence ComEA-like helix-hairpin-helix protein